MQIQKQIRFDCHIQRVDISLASQLKNEGLSTFPGFSSLTDFAERGIGFCATINDRIISYAVSLIQGREGIDIGVETLFKPFLPKSSSLCREGINIGVETHPDFRNKGIATAVGAKLLAHCIEHDIYPHWSASYENVTSIYLAEKLGYVRDAVYEILGVS